MNKVCLSDAGMQTGPRKVPNAPKILIIEDDEEDAFLIAGSLRKGLGAIELTEVSCLGDARRMLCGRRPDAVIADLFLPDGRGTDLLRDLDSKRNFPLIVLTDYGDERVAVEAIKAGASDYLIKSPVTLRILPDVVRSVIAEWQEMRDRQQSEELLLAVTRGISASTGDEFFRLLVEHLAHNLHADVVFVGLAVDEPPTKLRTIAVHGAEGVSPNFEYSVKGTPCESVLNGGIRTFPNQITECFPTDHLLAEMGFVAYAGIPLFDSSNRILGLIGLLNRSPITNVRQVETMLQTYAGRVAAELERKRHDDLLAERNAQLNSLMRAIPELIYYKDCSGRFRSCNPAFEEFIGKPEAEILGRSLSGLVPQDLARIFHEYERKTLDTGEPQTFEQTFECPDGSIRYLETLLAPVLEKDHRPVGVVGVGRDITDRKQVEDSLRVSEARFRQFMEHNPAIAYIKDSDGRYIYGNSKWFELFNRPRPM